MVSVQLRSLAESRSLLLSLSLSLSYTCMYTQVHLAPLKLGDHEFPSTFTIMNKQEIGLLLGLDFLRANG